MTAAVGGRGSLRASHADREQVIGTLKTAFIQGVLAKDEFDLRVGQALASRTHAELAALTADLSTRLTAAQPLRTPGAQAGPRTGQHDEGGRVGCKRHQRANRAGVRACHAHQ